MAMRIRKTVTCIALALCMTAGLFPVPVQGAEDKKTVRVGYYDDSGAMQSGSSDDVRKSGYAYEYYQEIAKYTGWTYEYEYGSWDEIYARLLSGEVDIMAGISKMEGRRGDMLFPDRAMGEETYYIFVPEEDKDAFAYNVSALNGMRVGVRDDSCMKELLEQYAQENGVQCEAVAFAGLEERKEALARGELDCIMSVENDRMDGLEAVCKVGSAEFYFAVNKNRPDLLEELNNAQEQILSDSPHYISRLLEKYFNGSDTVQELTPKEQEWLEDHPQLRVGYLALYMPYCDRQEGSREPTGMLAEVLREFREYMGTEFVCTSFDNYSDMIQALESGEIDMVFPTYGDLWYSEHQNYTQTVTVVHTRMCVVYRGDYREDIYDRIAVSDGSPLQPIYLTINYPEAEQVFYKDWGKCLDAIQSGEVGCMLVNSDLLNRYTNQHVQYANLNVAELEDMAEFCFAVRRDNSVLYSILNKGIGSIDQTGIEDAIIRNSYVEPDYTLRAFLVNHLGTVLLLVAAFILLLILFFVLYSRRVTRDRKILQEAYDREKEYIADKEENFNIIGSLSRIYTSTYYIDLVDRTYQIMTVMDLEKDSAQGFEEDDERFERWVNEKVLEPYREDIRNFLDLSTLPERMESVGSLSMEYETESQGWRRSSFISVGRDAREKLSHVLLATQEINEEKKAQTQTQTALKEAYEAASRANHAKSDFLARMSHDIRTPMNAIIGMTAIAAAHLDDRLRVEDCLRKITASGRHLLTLINEVLDMSKIESGKLELAEAEFNLQELIGNMTAMMQPQIDAMGHELEVSVQDLEHENVIGDSLHIQQVFVNIMGNAVKYTPSGGKLKLSVREKENNVPRIGCYEFIFEDNGIGMSPEFIEHIFEPFSRENVTKDNKVQGTGLGLSIVFNIIRMMGGDIKVESEQGKGSKFIVTLFLRLQEEEDISFEKFADIRVLVVDDMQDACESTCIILNELGMKSEWVLNGQEAIEKIRATNPQNGYFAVMLDWKMPGMTGLDTAKAIRDLVGDELPIIILSGYNWLEIEAEARAAGVNAFISKPLSKSRLTYLFKRLMNGDKAESGNSLKQIESGKFAGKRILLAEDNEINAEIAKEILETAGLEVDHAWDGGEAVERLRASEPGHYSLVFMDVRMPVMDGYEATREIRSTDRADLQTIPIVAMTANAFAEDVREALQAGMNQHIAKPLEIKHIMEALQKWL